MSRMPVLVKLASVILAQGITVAYASDLNFGVMLSGQIQPGVYGRVELGNSPPPPVVYATPVVVVHHHHPAPPIYLHVPPGHAKHWDRYCYRYEACDRPVYFVKSAEYEPEGEHHGHHGKHRH